MSQNQDDGQNDAREEWTPTRPSGAGRPLHAQGRRIPRSAYSRDYDPQANSSSGGYIILQYGKAASKRAQTMASVRDTLVMIVIIAVILIGIRLFVADQFIIPSSSMEDTLPVGSRVLVNKLRRRPSSLARGEIIVFHDTHQWLSADQDMQGQSGLNGLLSKVNGGQKQNGYLIKRIIGLPGDLVECAGGGQPVMVNGKALDESRYLKAGANPSDFAFRVRVSPGNLFVMGDNRPNSADSRYHANDGNQGLVPMSSVVGVAVAVIWPASQWKRL